ncbi:MAG: response regulator transcription factor [Tannerella sp.]|jgi:DNA-binding NarL/FixJ family response regulator|nr:response regulator transcription factor [Tannerella sp.]
MKTNIILFDKQDITRLGMESLISKVYRPEQVYRKFYADTKSSLIQHLISNPDSLVVIDYTLSDLNSVDTLLNISARFPQTHWILFSDEISVQFLKKVICHDAFSVVLKNSEYPEIKTAILSALDEQSFICLQVKELLSLSDKSNTGINEILTLTEKEILREIAWGKTAKEIACSRNISWHTVITHRKNIYRKLEVNNSQEASRYALRAGIVDTSDYYI